MSGHSEDPVAEESKRFFTFFNLSMILVAITGVEIVIIYVQTFEGSSIIGILFLTSILKFIGVIWWFMHLRWDKILNTILFLLGLVIALGTYFAVIYMGDTHPVIENFEVIAVEANWESGKAYSSKDFIKEGEVFYQAISDHTSSDAFAQDSDKWQKVKGIPHQISWKVTSGDLVEIHSKNPEIRSFINTNLMMKTGSKDRRSLCLPNQPPPKTSESKFGRNPFGWKTTDFASLLSSLEWVWRYEQLTRHTKPLAHRTYFNWWHFVRRLALCDHYRAMPHLHLPYPLLTCQKNRFLCIGNSHLLLGSGLPLGSLGRKLSFFRSHDSAQRPNVRQSTPSPAWTPA